MATSRSRGRAARALACALLLGVLVLAAPAPHAASRVDVTVEVVGPAGAPVRDAVVELVPWDVEGGRARPAPQLDPAEPVRVVMDQIELAFEPHVLAVQRGTLVEFPNRDQVRHSIYSFSAPRVFEVELYRGSEVPPILFDRPGVVVLGCNIHDFMLGYVYVLESPWSTVSDEAGHGSIAGLEPATYRVRVRHPRLDASVAHEEIVRVEADTPLRLSLDRMPPPRPPLSREADDDGLDDLFGARST